MYPRNSASPEPIAIGPVVQISDGAVQTSGVTVRVKPIGVAEADGGGTTAYSTDGVVLYTPTQAETNYTSFVLIAKKTGCIPASVTVVTSASNTTGYAGTDQSKILNPGSTVNLSATSIKTATDVETDTQDIQARLPAALIDGRIEANAQVVGDKTGYTLTVTPPTAGTIADAVWDEAYNQHTTAGTFGKLMDILRKANTLIEGTVTSAITPTAGSFSTDVNYTTGAFNHSIMLFTSGSLAEQNSPILTYVNTNGVITVEQAFTAAPQVGDAFVIVPISHVHSLAAIADQVWDETLSGHLASGSTGEALNNSGGSGNPWITDLSTGYTGTQAGNILNQVKAKTDLITTGTIQSSIPVTSQGQITGPLFIGDDYLSANGRAFQWTVALPSGFVINTSTCRFGMEHAEGATEGASFAVSGTVTDAGSGNVTLSFDVPKATTGTLKAGFYRWSVEIASAGGNEVTRVASDGKKLVEWREKQT